MKSALAADDLAEWARADERFHQLLVERSGNGRLARMFHTIMDQSHRARMLTLRLRPKPTASVREHRAIVDAIRRGDRKRLANAQSSTAGPRATRSFPFWSSSG